MLLKRKYEQNKDHSFSQFVNIKAKGVMKNEYHSLLWSKQGKQKEYENSAIQLGEWIAKIITL